MELWVLGTILTFSAGIALIGIGWRGRRVDDHPLCRRCGFDLVGRAPDSTRCSECGADLGASRAIRIGHRRRRAGALYGGLALTLPALLVVSAVIVVRGRNMDLTPYKPDWLLARDITSGSPAAAKSLPELTKRLLAREHVADRHVTAIATLCLTNQGNQKLPWNAQWGMFIEAARGAGTLRADLWARYVRQAIDFELRLDSPRHVDMSSGQRQRTSVFRSPSIRPRNVRLANASFVVVLDWHECSIDDGELSLPASKVDGSQWRMELSSARNVTEQIGAPLLDLTANERLPLGLHKLRADLKVRVFDVPTVTGRYSLLVIPPDPAKQVLETDLNLSTALFPVEYPPRPSPARAPRPARRVSGSQPTHSGR